MLSIQVTLQVRKGVQGICIVGALRDRLGWRQGPHLARLLHATSADLPT